LADLTAAKVHVFVTVIEESTNVDAETSNWTTVTASSDMSPQEVLRDAAMHDDRLERLEATVVSPGNKKQLGNNTV